mmetsp:Transcript_14184/g.24108  ORF Transcript_14184/g.24108 Transcript_14184/m.24108 type:complete len:215 (+) Transcript_14184:779-1423(+)
MRLPLLLGPLLLLLIDGVEQVDELPIVNVVEADALELLGVARVLGPLLLPRFKGSGLGGTLEAPYLFDVDEDAVLHDALEVFEEASELEHAPLEGVALAHALVDLHVLINQGLEGEDAVHQLHHLLMRVPVPPHPIALGHEGADLGRRGLAGLSAIHSPFLEVMLEELEQLPAGLVHGGGVVAVLVDLEHPLVEFEAAGEGRDHCHLPQKQKKH